MPVRLILLLFLFLGGIELNAQSIGFHAHEKLYYDRLYAAGRITAPTPSSGEIIPLNREAQNELTKKVFGFLPYWIYLNGGHHSIQYDLLTHISPFSFDFWDNGNFTDPPNWPWTDVINKAHENGVKVMLSVVNAEFHWGVVQQLIEDEQTKQKFITGLKERIELYSFDGVLIDFENLRHEDTGAPINAFLREVTDSIQSSFPEAEVAFASPAINLSFWNFSGLAESVDYLFMMMYDYYGRWSQTTGPVAPLGGGTYNVMNSLEQEYSTLVQYAPNRLILGVPYYGLQWRADTAEPYAPVTPYDPLDPNNPENDFIGQPYYQEAANGSDTHGTVWDVLSQTTYYSVDVGGGIYNQVWFDDTTSLRKKYSIVNTYDLRGAGIWALGYDGVRPELWDLLRDEFYDNSTSINDGAASPFSFSLGQNYPNPFNPSTSISYSLAEAGDVTLAVYSLLGERIALLHEGYTAAGTHTVQWNAEGLPSGVYFYELRFSGLQQGFQRAAKKMLLTK